MSRSSYLRYPHIFQDLVTFVAEDDVWLAPLDGGRAWRLSGQGLPARNPRFSPDGRSIAWTISRGSANEIVAASVDGGDYRQLTHWGHASTRNRGFTPAGDIVAITAQGQGDSRLTWARAVPLDGSQNTPLRYGPLDTLAWGPAVGDERPLVIGSALSREPAWWKRYRGGTAGKLWIDRDGGEGFERLVPELDGNLCDPVWIEGRIAFLSDHEGHGNIYSVAPDGSALMRHTDHETFYVRHLSSDGTRLAYESAGSLYVLDSLTSEPRRLAVTLGSAGHARQAHQLDVARHLARVVPDHQGHASVVESHGTLHLLAHRQGPARAIEATPGIRARLGAMLTAHEAVYVADAGGEEAIYVRELDALDQRYPSTGGAGEARRVSETAGPEAGDSDRPGAADTADGELALPRPVSAATLSADPSLTPDGSAPQNGNATEDAEPVSRNQAAEPAVPSAAMDPVRRFALPAGHRVRNLVASPDGMWLGVAAETGHAFLLDLARESWHELSGGGHGAVEHLAFSPDSRWLAFPEPVTEFGQRSRMLLVSTDEPDAVPLEATDGRFRDHSPSFTPDGKYLAFLSERSFDPLYDTHTFDLSFPASTKPYLLALDDRTPSLYGPRVYGSAATDATGNLDAGAASAPDKGSDGQDVPATRVVPEGLAARLFAVPVAQGRYESLAAVEGGLLWLADVSTGVTGDGRVPEAGEEAKRLERFEHATREVTVLVEEAASFAVSGDRRRLVYANGPTVRAVPTDGPADKDTLDARDIDLGRIRVRIEPGAVWAHAFDEAWRLQRDFFWVADMAGIDWEGVAETYRPLVDHLGSHDDLVDLLWELHGELGTSHAYVTPQPGQVPDHQGLLGADIERIDGHWRITGVLAGESSDPQAYSPLTAPGVGVRAGDTLLAIDGTDVPTAGGPAALLQGAGGRTVELTVRNGESSPEPGRVRRVSVVPVRDEQRLRYQEWVARNRREVREASDGAFGYLHIPDMMPLGWAQLYRDLDTETAREAVVVDVRRNRGGHTSQLVAEIISRKVTAWSVARDMEPWTYPASAARGPVVILTDEWAGSDGDIITQVSKLRGIGPVVGTRTWGGVIGIDGQFDLVDGTKVTQPRYATWFTEGVGWGVENRGVDPDIEVPFPPHAHLAGEDPQLEQGVAVLKEMLREIPTQLPPRREGYPRLRPGPLPARPQAGREQ